MTDLSGKTALVTGTARGIGRSIALALASAGATVLAHQRTDADASLVEEIRAGGGTARLVAGDLATPDGVNQAADATVAALAGAPLDILVHNAGVADFSGLADTGAEAFDRMFAINVRAPFLVTQALLPHLAPGGRIIVVSSVVARTYFAGILPYAMTKGAVNVFVQHLAAELGAQGITVNAVAPGAIATDMSAWLQSDEGEAQALGMQALQRVGQPSDIADVVAFLASPAARWVTGQIIDALGGTKL